MLTFEKSVNESQKSEFNISLILSWKCIICSDCNDGIKCSQEGRCPCWSYDSSWWGRKSLPGNHFQYATQSQKIKTFGNIIKTATLKFHRKLTFVSEY